MPHRVAGPGAKVRSATMLVVRARARVGFVGHAGGRISGYTIGNDMSSRDIEGENPLYLPQAKVYDRSCALGPCLLVSDEPLPPSDRNYAGNSSRRRRGLFRRNVP